MNEPASPSPNTNREPAPTAPSADSAPRTAAVPLVYRSDELLGGRNEVWIEHGFERYRLRLTSNGKLILTK